MKRSHFGVMLFLTGSLGYLIFSLGQFTRNYTQTTKRGLLTTKQAEHQAQESARCSACFVVRGFQRGQSPHLAHDFACKV